VTSRGIGIIGDSFVVKDISGKVALAADEGRKLPECPILIQFGNFIE
jgi:hypothetical protein